MVEATTPPNPADPSDERRSTPDPTLLTIDSIRREITMLTELFTTRLDGMRELVNTQINDAEKVRNERLQSQRDLFETMIDDAEKIRNERLNSVDALMERSEEQRREQKADTKAAVDAALDSQKEATAKMEKSISDQITSLLANFTTSIAGLAGNVSDLKDRLTVLESVKQGQVEQKAEARAITAGQIAAIGAAIALAGLVIGIFVYLGGSP